MNALIIYYSRTDTTKKVAESLKSILKCDIEEISSVIDRSGAKGYMISGKEAFLKRPAKIKQPQKDSSSYDLVLIGTPVWAWNMSSPIRAYLMRSKAKLSNVAFFCTMGGSGSESTFKEMETICGKKPIDTIAMTTKAVLNGDFKEELKSFAGRLKK